MCTGAGASGPFQRWIAFEQGRDENFQRIHQAAIGFKCIKSKVKVVRRERRVRQKIRWYGEFGREDLGISG